MRRSRSASSWMWNAAWSSLRASVRSFSAHPGLELFVLLVEEGLFQRSPAIRQRSVFRAHPVPSEWLARREPWRRVSTGALRVPSGLSAARVAESGALARAWRAPLPRDPPRRARRRSRREARASGRLSRAQIDADAQHARDPRRGQDLEAKIEIEEAFSESVARCAASASSQSARRSASPRPRGMARSRSRSRPRWRA